jgi:hypothetical protein
MDSQPGRAPRDRRSAGGPRGRVPGARPPYFLGALASLALASLALISGCTLQSQVHEAEFYQLVALLPGDYDNTTQAQGDVQRGVHPPHDALVLKIVPIDAPVIGKHAFYVQEAAADDPRRIMAQRVWTVDKTDKTITQTVWTIKEPLRWRDAQPDLLIGMMEQDVTASRGCTITWKKEGMRFVASNDPKTCTSTSRATNGTVHVETRMELDATELALAETAKDAAGQLVQGRTDDPFYKFHREAP